jgi:hypothetical protein
MRQQGCQACAAPPGTRVGDDCANSGVRPAHVAFWKFLLRLRTTYTCKWQTLRGPMERRSGKDRRQFADPCFGSQACPDRRTGEDRRRLDYQHMPGHPLRKWVVLIGGLFVVLLLALFFALSVSLSHKSTYKTIRSKTITFGHYQHDQERHACAMLPLSPL